MRTILIDPVAQTVTEHELAPGLAAMYEALHCSCIDIRGIGHDRSGRPVDLICDDEGRLIDGQRCFFLGGEGGHLIAGRALLASHDSQGETTACGLSLLDAAAKIGWTEEDLDYTPPPPLVIGFDSFEMLKFLGVSR